MKATHYYACHAMGWATAETRDKAIAKLLLNGFTDSGWVKNCLKDGRFVAIYSCQVHAAPDAEYAIENYVPVGVETDDYQHNIVTHLTQKAYAIAPDLHTRVRELESELRELKA
jgi:hypothetical protein